MSEESKKILEMLASGKITVDEAERLLNALAKVPLQETPAPEAPEFLCIKVDGETKVNIRVPLQLVRSGIKLASFMPHDVATYIGDKLRSKGIDLDKFDPESLEKLIKELKDLSIDVNSKQDKVKIYCE